MSRPIEKHALIGLASGKRGQLVCLPDGTLLDGTGGIETLQ
jgi:hypothetical protein